MKPDAYAPPEIIIPLRFKCVTNADGSITNIEHTDIGINAEIIAELLCVGTGGVWSGPKRLSAIPGGAS